MSTAGVYQRTFKPRPPLKGAFPLDHEGECKNFKEIFMNCMKTNLYDSSKCRLQSKDYLMCRMEKDLMQPETLTQLGYKDLEQAQ